MTWLDTGTFDSLCDTTNYVQTIEKKEGFKNWMSRRSSLEARLDKG